MGTPPTGNVASCFPMKLFSAPQLVGAETPQKVPRGREDTDKEDNSCKTVCIPNENSTGKRVQPLPPSPTPFPTHMRTHTPPLETQDSNLFFAKQTGDIDEGEARRRRETCLAATWGVQNGWPRTCQLLEGRPCEYYKLDTRRWEIHPRNQSLSPPRSTFWSNFRGKKNSATLKLEII